MRTILIVEDDHDLQKIYKEKITLSGYEAVVASSVNEVEEYLVSNIPSLILLDIMLPGGKNGFDLLESLKSREKLKDIPVIVLTNLDSEEKVTKEIGAQKYMIKANTKPEDIVLEIANVLAQD